MQGPVLQRAVTVGNEAKGEQILAGGGRSSTEEGPISDPRRNGKKGKSLLVKEVRSPGQGANLLKEKFEPQGEPRKSLL